MAEVAGLVLGALSILSLFGTAQEGFRLLVSVKQDFAKQSNYLHTRLQVEDHKLKLWGRYMGMTDVDNCKVFYQQPKPTQALCIAILSEFSALMNDADELENKYGLKAKRVDLDMQGINFADEEMLQSDKMKGVFDTVKTKLAKEISTTNRWRWSIHHQSKFEKLLDRLEYLNGSLWNCLSPAKVNFLNVSLNTFVLPTMDDAVELRELQKRTENTQEILAAGAHLARTNIETIASEADDPSKMPPVKPLPSDHFSNYTHDNGNAERPMADKATPERSTADYKPILSSPVTRTVLIEWRSVQNIKADDRELVENRLRALTQLLTIAPKKLSDFRILPCLGIVKSPSTPPDQWGLVFDLPTYADPDSFPVTLHQLIRQSADNTYPTPALGDRFALAKALACALALFHASKWLHKGLCSQNILFFKNKDNEDNQLPSLADPYIGGFDYARPDRPGEVSGPRKMYLEREHNVYRHPDVQDDPIQQPLPSSSSPTTATPTISLAFDSALTRYQKVHDIYSLGVILYEIGTWKSALQAGFERLNPSAFREQLVSSCPELGPLMGTKYERIVRRCLKGDFDVKYVRQGTWEDEGKLQRAFWSKVIVELNDCNA